MPKQDKVAIVTGASRGIGFAIADELAGMGYSLGLVARTREDIDNAGDKIRKKFPGVKTATAAFDVADSTAAKEFIKRVISELGSITVLVNNAGDYRLGTSEFPAEETQKMMDVNFTAAIRFVQEVLPSMKKLRRGYIFNIASICGVEAFSDTGAYSASKFALVGYSSALAQELAQFGIKVTALCPSWVNTQQSAGAPVKPDEMIQPEDIAVTVRYLLSLGPTASIREIVIHCR